MNAHIHRQNMYINAYNNLPGRHGLGAIVNTEVEAEVPVCECQAGELVVGYCNHGQGGRAGHLSSSFPHRQRAKYDCKTQ